MLVNYIKITLKILLRHKLFTFINLFGISFTLLFLVCVSSLVDHTLGQMPPETRLNRTLVVATGRLTTTDGMNVTGPLFSPYFMNEYVKLLKTPSVISLASFHNPVTVYHHNSKHVFNIKYTDAEFWQIMDFKFLEGRPFTSADVSNVSQVAVISAETRDRYFMDDHALGKVIEIDDRRYQVKGVVENVPIMRIFPYADVWLPMTHTKESLTEPTLMGNFPGWFALTLAESPDDFPEIKAEFQSVLQQVNDPEGVWDDVITGTNTYGESLALTFFQQEHADIRPLMIAVFILIFIFLILPAVNLININLSRVIERSSEIGIRKAFGASSRILVGQFIIENIIITLLGGLISLFLAMIIMNIINEAEVIKHASFTLNYRIFGFSLAVCFLFGLMSGVIPAYRMSRLNPADALTGDQK